ncbi:MAG: cytochrome c [Bacteroidales bacterium]|nr:cytochrome c [Bacteroidales bacterium]
MFKTQIPLLIVLIIFMFSCKSGENPSQKATQEKPDNGKLVYMKYCLSCHQYDGSGVPGMYPPVKATDWVSGDKERLITVVIKGLDKEIEVNGEIYNNEMPSHHYLSDVQIADLLTYLRSNFGNNAGPVTVEEVTGVRKKLE